MIIGPPNSEKSTKIQSITKTVDDLLHGYFPCLGTAGMAAFVIAGAAWHSTFRLPINRQFRPFQGSSLRNLQELFLGGTVIVINEVSMMGRNMLVQIDKILRQASRQEDLPYGGFIVIFVGDFNSFHLLVINRCGLKEIHKLPCYSTISKIMLYRNNPIKKVETH